MVTTGNAFTRGTMAAVTVRRAASPPACTGGVPRARLPAGRGVFSGPAASGPSPSASAPDATSPSPTCPWSRRSVQAAGPGRRRHVHRRPLLRRDRGWLRVPRDRRRPQARGPLSGGLDPPEVPARVPRTRRLGPQPGRRHRDRQGQRGDGHEVDLPDRTDHPRDRGPRPIDRRRDPTLQRLPRYLARLARDDRRTNADRTLRPDRDRAALAGALGGARHGRDGPPRRVPAQVVPADDVPVPVGRPPHRPLVHRDADRRARPVPPDARLQRLLPDRFRCVRAAGRERRHQERRHPFTWTMQNIDTMRRQFQTMGAMFDWETEVVTADPAYYKWNQWLFLQLLKAGLAYRATSPVDWCPNDGTLAREQVEGPTAAAGAAARSSRSATSSSGSCGRRPTRTSCSTSRGSTGPNRSRPSRRTGSAGARAPRSTSRPRRTTISPAATSSASSRPGRTRCSAPRSWSWRRSIPSSSG